MASASIPIFFPAVKIDKHWHGDGGIRLYAPLSPAIHLGADRILAISTRYGRSRAEADQPVILDYPPPAQIAGVLMNAIFLDLLDQDADRLERTNRLLEKLPEDEREGRRVIKLFILRPSQDLGRLAAQFEPKLPRLFRTLMRGQGTQTTSSPDWLSMVMFQTDYLSYLVELGARDAEAKRAEIEEFFK
jgi:NTE family protein